MSDASVCGLTSARLEPIEESALSSRQYLPHNTLHLRLARAEADYADAERERAAQLRRRDEVASAGVDTRVDTLVERVERCRIVHASRMHSEAEDPEPRWRQDLELRLLVHEP